MNILRTFNLYLLTPSQVYLGYTMDDAFRLVRYRKAAAQTKSGFYTDYFGIRTNLANFMDDPGGLDQRQGAFPFPNDGLHSELVEYLGTVKAIEATGPEVTVVEMGAGYAPWLVFSGVVALQRGAKSIRLVAVEAEKRRHALVEEHFRENGFPAPGEPAPGVTTELIHAAISDSRGTISFGSAGIHDWGGAIQKVAGQDYRAAEVTSDTVATLLMADVLAPYPVVDLLHIDIQGHEVDALRASLDEVCGKVRYMVIGTHSRVIEGELITMLRERGWTLMHEKPCQFGQVATPELAGATTVDGAQVWANTPLGAPAEVEADLSDEEKARIETEKETVGVQHVIAKEYVWTLQTRINELETQIAQRRWRHRIRRLRDGLMRRLLPSTSGG